MSQIQELHQQAMDLAQTAQVAKLTGNLQKAEQLFRQAFEKELLATELVASNLEAEPTRSVLHRSAATLAIDCGDVHTAERLIAIALSGNPPQEIAEELKDLFIQINIHKYFARRGIAFDEAKLLVPSSEQDLVVAWDRWFLEVDRLEPEASIAESNEYEQALIEKYRKQGLIL